MISLRLISTSYEQKIQNVDLNLKNPFNPKCNMTCGILSHDDWIRIRTFSDPNKAWCAAYVLY